MDEWRNILATIAQRRNGNDESAEPGGQVFGESSRIHGPPQITVRGGYYSSVYFDAAWRPLDGFLVPVKL